MEREPVIYNIESNEYYMGLILTTFEPWRGDIMCSLFG